MTIIVLDTSIAIKWVLPEIYQAEALSLISTWRANDVEVIVPGWFACEVSNVLFQRMRQDDLTLDAAILAIQTILSRVVIREAESDIALRALEIAHLLRLRASYDAHYIAIAERLRCELWTADERLFKAAHTMFRFVRSIADAELLPIE